MDFLYDMHLIKRLPIKEDQVLATSGYSRTDSTGYRKIMKKHTKETCYIIKSKGEVSLTDAGVEFLKSQNGEVGSGKKHDNASIEEFFKNMIIKTGKGKVPPAKLDIVWALLKDRQAHSVQEILKASGYARTDSTGYKLIMKGLKDCQLIEKEGKGWKFDAEKVFPYPE